MTQEEEVNAELVEEMSNTEAALGLSLFANVVLAVGVFGLNWKYNRMVKATKALAEGMVQTNYNLGHFHGEVAARLISLNERIK